MVLEQLLRALYPDTQAGGREPWILYRLLKSWNLTRVDIPPPPRPQLPTLPSSSSVGNQASNCTNLWGEEVGDEGVREWEGEKAGILIQTTTPFMIPHRNLVLHPLLSSSIISWLALKFLTTACIYHFFTNDHFHYSEQCMDQWGKHHLWLG